MKSRNQGRAAYIAVAIAAVVLVAFGVGASLLVFGANRDPPAPTTSAVATSAPIVVETAPSAVVEAGSPPRLAPSVHAPSAEQSSAAEKIAKGFCAEPHIRECYGITNEACVSAVRSIDLGCLHSDDRPECMATRFRARFASTRVHSTTCDDVN